ncbi:MAG: hypothetical protein FJX53_05995 [Alphaproteobacteria bacterium]|nr:hypothetical protein [Alphaproteobacteria bacterium]
MPPFHRAGPHVAGLWRSAAAGLLALALTAGAALAQGGFLRDVDDLPLAPGLTERAEAATVFDKPGGRVVDTIASGTLDRGSVVSFYATALPALGWTPRGELRWQREGEVLAIDIAGGTPLVVLFFLSPG